MRCKVCQAYIPEGATYCLECGTDVESMPEVVCRRCGSVTSKEARFCRKCGAPIESDESPVGSSTCLRCGADVPKGTRYCPNCGTNQNGESPTTTPTGTQSAEMYISENIMDAVEARPDTGECPRCGAPPRGLGRFCYNCGRFLGTDIEDVICPRCGSTNPLRYIRCQYCGADLPSSSEPDK